MVITRKVKLYPEPEIALLFENIADKQTQLTNWWIDKIRELETTNISELQKFYYEAKAVSGLGAHLTQGAKLRAIRVARVAKRKRSNSPHVKSKIIVVKTTLLVGDKLSFQGLGQRVRVSFKPFENGTFKESIIKKVDKDWYGYLVVEIKSPKIKRYKHCMGVDLGVAKIAAVCDYDGKNTRFFKGEPLRFKKNHYRALKADLQSKKKWRTLKKIARHEGNWVSDMNHKISREIVNMAVKNKRNIVLEELTGITERLNVNKKTRTMLKNWSFRQLADFIRYKAEQQGILVLMIDPRRTSKTCPKCKYYSRSNRKRQSLFKCGSCGYESNADRVGAMNIALRGEHVLSLMG